MEVGVSFQSFGLSKGVPLAGYVTRKDRIATHSLDDVGVRSIALKNKKCSVVICSVDLLVISHELYSAVKNQIHDKTTESLMIFLHATHTHSSVGGYWDHKIAKYFMGNYQPGLFSRIVDTISRSAIDAWRDLEPCKSDIDSDVVFGMNESRRIPDDFVDNTITVARFDKENGDPKAAIVSFAAHPVIAAEKDFHALSADFPGEICTRLEKEIPVVAYLQGAVGGVSPAWPDHIQKPKEHIKFMADPLIEKATEIYHSLKPKNETAFHCGSQVIDKPVAGAEPFPKAWKVAPLLFSPIVKLWDRFFDDKYADRQVFLFGIRLGDQAIFGFPADLGDKLSREINDRAKEMGYSRCTCLSQTGDYIGYVHREQDMDDLPPKGHRGMYLYENFMGFHGRMAGRSFTEASITLLKTLQEK